MMTRSPTCSSRRRGRRRPPRRRAARNRPLASSAAPASLSWAISLVGRARRLAAVPHRVPRQPASSGKDAARRVALPHRRARPAADAARPQLLPRRRSRRCSDAFIGLVGGHDRRARVRDRVQPAPLGRADVHADRDGAALGAARRDDTADHARLRPRARWASRSIAGHRHVLPDARERDARAARHAAGVDRPVPARTAPGQLTTLRKVQLPNALPAIFASLRIAAPLALDRCAARRVARDRARPRLPDAAVVDRCRTTTCCGRRPRSSPRTRCSSTPSISGVEKRVLARFADIPA